MVHAVILLLDSYYIFGISYIYCRKIQSSNWGATFWVVYLFYNIIVNSLDCVDGIGPGLANRYYTSVWLNY